MGTVYPTALSYCEDGENTLMGMLVVNPVLPGVVGVGYWWPVKLVWGWGAPQLLWKRPLGCSGV